ncbi:PAAR domain-containing protein [Marinomonas ostreistagni]|uniref:PAAR domain-containing protein n=1 Tax=Marinomonas ostreistagni TaxID=359209 RepID=A0ABS0ZAR3_9GAMM|nr:PAAR domain-containing protein [Marinomonas ostreistagni]MBJ7550741.1 PAAR domain-containing protein [Marinomonas ostreistagni]
MLSVAQMGKTSTGHGGYAPVPSVMGASTVFVNGIPALRQTDAFAVHCVGPSCHFGTVQMGSSSVYCEGLELARIGDPINCGDVVSAGSANVFAGD